MVRSNPVENSCLNASVLLRRESFVATPDPLWIFAKGLAKGKLRGVVDDGYLP
jgi:hypothetical protein